MCEAIRLWIFQMTSVSQSFTMISCSSSLHSRKLNVLESIAWQVHCSIQIMLQVPSIFNKTLESIRNTLFNFHWELTTSAKFTQKSLSVSEWTEPFARNLLLTEYRCLFSLFLVIIRTHLRQPCALYSGVEHWSILWVLLYLVHALCAPEDILCQKKGQPLLIL